ncbi:right-handed parallel beta-helix repeat-containing protein [Chryseobacterium sp.]|uniref:right-handed parallel beta-helix repeat-containing protein n=1 Tax=Chryseobacterium sp. TaxID=1871047 RepID=UPI00289B2244|nr:right-handed parallel beta-helix repeat-containing protein [Chryseobacterium sp.]
MKKNQKKHVKKNFLFLFLLLSAFFYAQTTYYVKAGATGTGTSWDNAMGVLPTTILGGGATARPLNNVYIYIAEGSYPITNTYAYVGNDVLIQGGYPNTATGTDLSGYAPNIYITKLVKTTNVRFANITATTNAFAVNTFTIKGIEFNSTGATGLPGNIVNHEGGTRYYQLKVEDCTIADSEAGSAFFRIAVGNTGKVTHWFNNNKFYRNTMGPTGPFEYTTVQGDVKVLVSNNLFGEGNATDGTGFYATTAGSTTTSQTRFYIIGNIFSCGTANSTTGGIYFTTAGNALIKNNVFLGVRGNNYGGAIFLTNTRGIQIEDNYFIQNFTANTSFGAGAAIAIETGINVGSIITTNHIKGNFFYENKLNTITAGGSAISFATGPVAAGAAYDIDNNVFAYNNVVSGQQAVIQTRGSDIGNIRNNIFHGNRNSNGTTDIYAELRAPSLLDVTGAISGNKFQLANALAYTGNALQPKIAVGGNTYNSTQADIGNVKAGDFVIDCYTGAVGCFKLDTSTAGAKLSKFGISTFKTQPSNWPEKNIDGNAINNGIMVLDSGNKPFVITRVNNPAQVLGTDPALKGALAYDTNQKCLKLFDGDKWDCIAKGCDKSIYDVLEAIKANLVTP